MKHTPRCRHVWLYVQRAPDYVGMRCRLWQCIHCGRQRELFHWVRPTPFRRGVFLAARKRAGSEHTMKEARQAEIRKALDEIKARGPVDEADLISREEFRKEFLSDGR